MVFLLTWFGTGMIDRDYLYEGSFRGICGNIQVQRLNLPSCLKTRIYEKSGYKSSLSFFRNLCHADQLALQSFDFLADYSLDLLACLFIV
jgi:hypothetical protein